jgi:hypothetical protein
MHHQLKLHICESMHCGDEAKDRRRRARTVNEGVKRERESKSLKERTEHKDRMEHMLSSTDAKEDV